MCGSTRHYTSQCTRHVKPKAKNAEYDEDSNWQAEAEWQESTWENEEYEASKGKKGKGKRSKSKGSRRARVLRDLLLQDLLRTRLLEQTDLSPSPNQKLDHAWQTVSTMMSTKSKPTWRHATWNSTDYTVCTVVEPQKKLPVFKPGQANGRLLLNVELLYMVMMPRA